jgi:hypothetical protein
MRDVSSVLILSLVLSLRFGASPLGAQTTASGTIRGTASDTHGAVVPGVLLTATSATVPGVRSATTDAAGRYVLGDLPPGEYTVVAELAGFARTRRVVFVRAGLNLVVDVAMAAGAVDETVEVRGETPLLERQRAGQSVNVSGELLRAIPLLERHEWFGALVVAPGVTSAEWVNNERLFFVHGADSGANVVQIDGADVTPAAGSAIQHVGLSSEAIADIQIKTSGTDASAPLGVGGIINIATSSGTNQVKGSVSVSIQPEAWNGANTPQGTSATVSQRQADVSLGAPLLKDRIWGFGAYRYTDVATGVSRTAAQLEALRALIPGYSPFGSTNEAHFSLVKVTARPWLSHEITGLYQNDLNPTHVADPLGAQTFAESTGGSGALIRMSSIWSNRLTTLAAASYNDKRRATRRPEVEVPFQPVYQSTFLSAGLPVGNGFLVNTGSTTTAQQLQPNSKLTLSFDATLAAGTHTLQAGIYLQPRTRIARVVSYLNGGFIQEEFVLRRAGDYSAGVVPFHRILLDTTEIDAARSEGQDYAFYAQDAWRPWPRLTVTAGLRVDRVTWQDVLFGVEGVRSTEIGPRLGVNYSITADARNVARAHWVRVHDRPTQVATSVGSAALGQRDLYDTNLDGTFETVLVTPSTFAVTAGRTFDPDLHVPFVDEWGAGYTRQLEGRLTVGVDLVHRHYRDRPTLVDVNSRYEGGRFAGYHNEAFNATYLVTNNRWNTPVYTSAELSVTKRTAHVQGVASYVRQWRHIDGTWQPNDPASFLQPSAFGNDRGLGSVNGSLSSPTDANSLSGTHMTQRSTGSAQWQDHAVRAGVTWTAPLGLLAGGSYTFQSGVWSGPVVTRLAAADPAFGPSTLTLSNGRVVSNPLATTIRFAHADRGQGQLETRPFHSLSLRVGRRFSLRGVKLDAALDLFNLTNNGADLSFQSGANQQYNPLFGTTTFRQLPRSAQAVVRASF